MIQLALEGHVSLSGVEGAAIELGLLSGAVIGITMLWVQDESVDLERPAA